MNSFEFVCWALLSIASVAVVVVEVRLWFFVRNERRKDSVRKSAGLIVALCLLTNTARADRDPDFESGLVSIPVEGSQVLPGPSYARNQLITQDTTTRPTVGAIAAVAGGLSLVSGWVFYVARQNVRLTPRLELGSSIDTWENLGVWSLSLTGFGAANLIAAEALLLPESKGVPTLAIIGGVAGLAGAAVGAGFILGGTHCAPVAYTPGSQFPVSCMSGTSDAIFGWNVLLTSAPLLALPIVYALRRLFAGAPDSLTMTGTGVNWVSRF